MAWLEIESGLSTNVGTVPVSIADNLLTIVDNSDNTKGLQFQLSGITTATTRTLTAPDANTTIVGTDATQTLTNKTLTSPTLTTPALGTPASGVLTNCTGLPISSGVSGLGSDVAAFLATPSSANLATAVTGETGSGALVFATSPTLVTPLLGTPTSGTLTNCTGLPVSTGLSGFTEWTAVAYNAGNFTASSGNWTVDEADQAVFKYTKIGKRITVNFLIQNSDVSATPTSLQITIPGGFTVASAAAAIGPLRYQDNGGALTMGVCTVSAGGTVILCQKADAAAWSTTATDNTLVFGQITFETTS